MSNGDNMRVVFDLRFVQKGKHSGLSTYSLEMVHGLSRVAKDIDLAVVTAPEFFDQQLPAKVFRSDSQFLSLKQHWDFAFSKPWGKWQPDIYHYSHFNAPSSGKALLIATIHDLYPLTEGYCNSLQRKYFVSATESTLKRSSKTICISDFTYQEVVRHFPRHKEKLVVIGEAASSILHTPNQQEMTHFCARYKLPLDSILYVGNNKPHKNNLRLLQAYTKLPEELRLKHHLVLAGNITEYIEAGFVEKARELGIEGTFHLPGYFADDDISSFYHSASVYAQLSLMEAFGLPVAEAQACGIPCLVSSAGALPQTAGEAALMVNPFDVEEIANKLTQLLTDEVLRRKMIERGLELSKNRTWDTVARQLADLYRQVLTESK
jgi:glycosyltransferase involved in cell wall biosynthesis